MYPFCALQPPDDEDMLILVMPLLRWYDDPRFDTLGEAVHFFDQIFKVWSKPIEWRVHV